MFIPDPGSRTQKQHQKERGEKKFIVIPFFVATNFTKLKIISFFNVEEKNLANFKKIIELFTQKIVKKLSKIWVRDPGSGKNLFRIPDPEVKKAPDPGSATLYLNTTNPVLRIRTRTRIRKDPKLLAGSGSDPEPN